MDWDVCCICQLIKEEELRGLSKEGREKDGHSGKSYATIANAMYKLSGFNLFSLETFDCDNNETSIVDKLKEKRAVYHDNCVSKTIANCRGLQRRKRNQRTAASKYVHLHSEHSREDVR